MLSYSFKDYSRTPCPTGKTWADEYRIQSNIDTKRTQTFRTADWLGEGLGIWALSGAAWYREEAVATCQELGRQMRLVPVTSRHMDETENPPMRNGALNDGDRDRLGRSGPASRWPA